MGILVPCSRGCSIGPAGPLFRRQYLRVADVCSWRYMPVYAESAIPSTFTPSVNCRGTRPATENCSLQLASILLNLWPICGRHGRRALPFSTFPATCNHILQRRNRDIVCRFDYAIGDQVVSVWCRSPTVVLPPLPIPPASARAASQPYLQVLARTRPPGECA